MARSSTRKRNNRIRRRRFRCAWLKDGGAAALADAQERKKAADEQKAKLASRSGGLIHNPIQSSRPVSLLGLARDAGYRDAAYVDSSARAALRALESAKPSNPKLAKARSSWR